MEGSERITLRIKGMTCSGCAQRVREAIESLEGVRKVMVEVGTARIEVDGERSEAIRQRIGTAVHRAGYRVVSTEGGELDLSLILGLTTLAVMMIGKWLAEWDRYAFGPWLALALALLVQILLGARFYRGAWARLREGRTGMDTLVSLGSTTAFLYSVALVVLTEKADHLYFMESVGILSLVALGHEIERRTARRAGGLIESLLSLAPEEVDLLGPDGKTERVSVRTLSRGARIRLSAGERIAVDGVVLEGESLCDESTLTGESLPVRKGPEDRVHAGTRNLMHTLVVRVTGTGRETALARIIATVEEARRSRSDIQKLVDRISNVFVPVVILCALATLAGWTLFPEAMEDTHQWLSSRLWELDLPGTPLARGIVVAAAVLIIACPCAMGLATPIALLAGSHAAASRGILVRNARALERTGTIDRIVFDKTGTLTRGHPEVTARAFLGEETLVRESIHSLTAPSRHPYSRAVAHEGIRGELVLENWCEVPGKGVKAVGTLPEGPETLRLGSLGWMEASGIDTAPARDFLLTHAQAPIIALAAGERLLALFALEDPPKPDIEKMFTALDREGMAVSLVSGDREATVRALAERLGIADSFHEVPPEDKARFIGERQRKGERVCFVGDGINDAPALDRADLGIAVGSASDMARESADVVLLRSDVQAIPQAIRIARATRRTIGQNLFWAFFYNVVGIPLAALGLLHPLVCALAMALSDLVVVGNAVRLRYRAFER